MVSRRARFRGFSLCRLFLAVIFVLEHVCILPLSVVGRGFYMIHGEKRFGPVRRGVCTSRDVIASIMWYSWLLPVCCNAVLKAF